MSELQRQVEKAMRAPWRLWLLNKLLHRLVPFNKPHGLRIIRRTGSELIVGLPHQKRNLNHIKGIHACALATLCEYVSGLSLLLHLDPKQYRIILKSIDITYHYQAKEDVNASFELSEDQVEEEIGKVLRQATSMFRTCQVEVYDRLGNHICTGQIQWQIKFWDKVKTGNSS